MFIYLCVAPLIACFLFLAYMHMCARFPKISRIGDCGEEKLKIIQLSDIHINMMFASYKRLAAIFEKEKPHMFFITGDLIDKKTDVEKAERFLSFIQKFAPVVFCMGNHDYKAYGKSKKEALSYIKRLLKIGVVVLQNSSFLTSKGNRNFRVVGIDEFKYNFHDVKKAFAYTPEQDEITLALCHNPDIIFRMGKTNKKIDMLFTGHIHGGQIWLCGFEYAVLRRERTCRMGMRRGLHTYKGVPFYINRGLGVSMVPFRFLASPEIAVFYF